MAYVNTACYNVVECIITLCSESVLLREGQPISQDSMRPSLSAAVGKLFTRNVCLC